MNIPVYSSYVKRKGEMKKAELELIKQQTVYLERKQEAYSNMLETSNAARQAIMDIANKPRMTLNEKLYSGTSGYENPCTFENHSFKKQASKIAYTQSSAAQAMIGRFVDMVYGPKLEIQSMPLWDLIPNQNISSSNGEVPEEVLRNRQSFSKNIENRYKIWSEDYKSDYSLKTNHIKRSRQTFEDLLKDGESISLLRYSRRKDGENPLTVQRIHPDNLIRIDSKVTSGNTEQDGIEYNSKNQPVAYHIKNCKTGKSIRVPRFGQKSGRTFVIHNTIGSGHRGEPLLSGVITEITKIADFEALEIQAAVINAMFAVWVETEVGGDEKKLGQKQGVTGVSRTDTYRSAWDSSEFKMDVKKSKMEDGGIIAEPGQGQKMHSFDTKRPSATFKEFYNAVVRNLYAAKGMSRAVALYDFDGSYSASRGELLVFWNRVMTMRLDHVLDYENIVYKMWLWGEIDNNNVVDYGWYTNSTTRDAIAYSKRTGPQRPDIDPMKSAQAHELESKNSWKTDQQISAERGGGDWDDNVPRKTIENNAKAKANEPIVRLDKTTYSFSESKTDSTTESKTIEG
jgi:capsid protein